MKKSIKQIIKECINEVLTENNSFIVLQELSFVMKALRDMKNSKSYPNDKLDIVRDYIKLVEKMFSLAKANGDIKDIAKQILNYIENNSELIITNQVVSEKFLTFLKSL